MNTLSLSHIREFRVCLLSVLVLGANTHAATIIPKENPYAKAIVGRNVFSLISPSPARIVDPPPTPRPRITLQGVTTMLGRRQVLFKVHVPPRPSEPAREMSGILSDAKYQMSFKEQVPPRPGEPANEAFFVLSEGEREGEIEVLEIDERAGTVRFNNHGSVEILNLKNDADRPK
jgi:hypothetical protein